jgi:hypothetical protein
MAHAIARAILSRAEERGRIHASLDVASSPLVRPGPDGLETHVVPELERPPMDHVRADVEPVNEDGPGAIALG